MKLKSLLLGSAAALTLSTGAFAADPTLTLVSLGVCDAYGISGLTIESDDTCLRISGSVSYEYRWGDYNPSNFWAFGDVLTVDDNGGAFDNDARGRLETLLTFQATTQTDAGAARATIQFRERQSTAIGDDAVGGWPHALRIQQAWVSFGDTTVLTAGHNPGTIARTGNDTPFNTFLGAFVSEYNHEANGVQARSGVYWTRHNNQLRTNGHSIQVVSEVADGVTVGAALESLDGNDVAQSHGTFIAFVEASGAWGGAHATVLVGDVLGNDIAPFTDNAWAFHTGATLRFDNFRVRGALAVDDTEWVNALFTAEGTFDLFRIAGHIEYVNTGNGFPGGSHNLASIVGANTDAVGAGLEVGFAATDTVEINAGFRFLSELGNGTGLFPTQPDVWQAAVGVTAEITDTIEVAAQVGFYNGGYLVPLPVDDTVAYGQVDLTYAPGGGFETGVGGTINALGAYQLRFNASKSF